MRLEATKAGNTAIFTQTFENVFFFLFESLIKKTLMTALLCLKVITKTLTYMSAKKCSLPVPYVKGQGPPDINGVKQYVVL